MDLTMAFGSRASSAHIQRVAEAIVVILANNGVQAHNHAPAQAAFPNGPQSGPSGAHLGPNFAQLGPTWKAAWVDDMIVVCPDHRTAQSHYAIARDLLAELGLSEAVNKAQPPSHRVRMLGIDIDAATGTLSIPPDKLEQVVQYASNYIAPVDSPLKTSLRSKRQILPSSFKRSWPIVTEENT